MSSLRIVRFAFLAAIAVGALVLGPSGTALASCVAPPDPVAAVNTADIVFVGTVTRVSSMGRTAEVAVLEVWRGPDQPARVIINEGLDDTMATSVDRTFVEGQTYLFFPYADPASGKLSDNSCSNTMAFDVSTRGLRPPGARLPIGLSPPATTGFDLGPLLPFGLAAVVFLVLLGIGLVARGREAS